MLVGQSSSTASTNRWPYKSFKWSRALRYCVNIFVLHEDPDKSARAHADTHVNKMTTEAVQIANTGLHLAGADERAFYGKTHTGHPWCEFAAKSFDHFLFVLRRARALGREFLRRYDGYHSSHQKIAQNWTHDDLRQIEQGLGRAESDEVWADIPQAMPDEYTQSDPIAAYREYYWNEKWGEDWFEWSHADAPEWFLDTNPRGRWSR